MFIAFEGPDKTGKSTSAAHLSASGVAEYNATKAMHAENVAERAGEDIAGYLMPTTYDRIDWLTHMVYRLAMPHRDWNDDRPRTVFAMPDTHLVLKVHHPLLVDIIEDELYTEGSLAPVNEMYREYVSWLAFMNRSRGYDLFKSISIVEVYNDLINGSFGQKLVLHENAAFSGTYFDVLKRTVTSDEELLDFLREQDRQLF